MKTPILKISIIFLLYFAAISFFLIGVRMFYEEQAAGKNLQERVTQEASEHTGSHSILFSTKKQMLQKGIAKNVIRLHVKANSNSMQDQILKLKVRDAVISDLTDCLKHIRSRREAEEQIVSRLAQIQQTAETRIQKEGYSYSAKVRVSDRLFPKKKYGDLTFPAGIYRSLCIDIGSAGGHNWWCVLFPSLCFIDETTAEVPAESKRKLKNSLTKEEYQLLSDPPKARSFFWDCFFK